MFQGYIRRGACIPACAHETEHTWVVTHAGRRSPRGLLHRQRSRQSAHTRQAVARNGRWSKKHAHAAAVRCAQRWFAFPPPPRAVIWHVPWETELRIRAGRARDTRRRGCLSGHLDASSTVCIARNIVYRFSLNIFPNIYLSPGIIIPLSLNSHCPLSSLQWSGFKFYALYSFCCHTPSTRY